MNQLSKKPIELKEFQIKALSSNKLHLVVKLMKGFPNEDVSWEFTETLLSDKKHIGLQAFFTDKMMPDLYGVKFPYDKPGISLWVREVWGLSDLHRYEYKFLPTDGGDLCSCKWRSPVQMPRDASRFTIKLLNVNVKRLQDISEEEAISSGVEFFPKRKDMQGGYTWVNSSKIEFMRMWDSYNKTCNWNSNPWVWVLKIDKE